MRIILADHNQKTLWALIVMLQEEPGLEIVGKAEDAQGLRAVAEHVAADLILLDMKLAVGRIDPVIGELHALLPRPIVAVMSSQVEDGRMALQAGADVFVSKGDRPDWLLAMLRGYAQRLQEGSDLS